jgi:hypothetical protein
MAWLSNGGTRAATKYYHQTHAPPHRKDNLGKRRLGAALTKKCRQATSTNNVAEGATCAMKKCTVLSRSSFLAFVDAPREF